jgi:hypothetical protein
LFGWASGNNATNVANDPLEAFFVPLNGQNGSNGCFFRLDDSDAIIAEWGGARSGEPTIDCSPIATGLETLANRIQRRLIKWPGRIYYWNTPFAGVRSSITHQGAGITQWVGTHSTSDIIRCGSPSAYVVDRTYDGIVPVMTGGGSHYFFRQVNCRGTHYRNMMNNSFGTSVRNAFALGLPATAITNATNNGSGKVRITSPGHGLGTGVYVRVNGVEGTTEANVFSSITVIDADTFDMPNVNFVNAFVLGSAKGRVAPNVYRTVFDNINIYTSDQFGLRIFTHAGDIHHYGEFWLEGTSEIPAAGTKGISVARNTNVFDRIDHWVGHTTVAAHRYAKALEIDNTRVVGMEWAHLHGDDTIECGMDWIHDNPDWTGGGQESCNIRTFRRGGPTTTGHPILRITATAAEVVDCNIDLNGSVGNSAGVVLVGRVTGTVYNSLSQFNLTADIQSRATSGNNDVITVSGQVYGVCINLKGVGSNTAYTRHPISIASTVPDGEVTIESNTFTQFGGSRVDDPSNRAIVKTGPRRGSAVYNPANLVDGAGVTTTVTVTGAVLGDIAEASFSLDLQGIMMTSWVSSANTVSVRFQNETGGAIDLGSGTINAVARSLV